jgi:hypothetical protein
VELTWKKTTFSTKTFLLDNSVNKNDYVKKGKKSVLFEEKLKILQKFGR